MQNINYKKKYLKYKKKYLELCNNINQSGGMLRRFFGTKTKFKAEEEEEEEEERQIEEERQASRQAARQAERLKIADTYETTLIKIPEMSIKIQTILDSNRRSLKLLKLSKDEDDYRLLDNEHYHRQINEHIECNNKIIELINKELYNENDKKILLNENNLEIYLDIKQNYNKRDLYLTYL